jgi:hypothetical protein
MKRLQNLRKINELGTSGNPIVIGNSTMERQKCLTEKKLPSTINIISSFE